MTPPLWAPWRSELVAGPKRDGCIFCLFPAENRDDEHFIVGRTERSFVMLNRFPYNNGHIMVLPRQHAGELAQLEPETFLDLHQTLSKSIEVVRKAYAPHGFNVGLNLGKVAGAGIPGHLHYHVVPRWEGDTNFMPVLGETKVMIEHLTTSYEKLKALF